MYKRCCDTGVLTKAGFNACKQAAKISKGFRGCTRSAVCAQQCVDALIPIMKEKCGASAPCEDVARFIKVRVWSVPARRRPVRTSPGLSRYACGQCRRVGAL